MSNLTEALHLHGLLSLHGFRHPEDFFSLPDLAVRIRRLWHFVASFCFRSVEAFAAHLHEPTACAETLSTIPLMPVKAAQQELLGQRRTREIYAAQLKARGMSSPTPKEDLKKTRFQPWTPSALRSGTLSSGEWASLVVADVNAGNQSCGNHVCIPEVCNKTRRSRDGYCRMIFWHYASILVEDKLKVIKVHGRELVPRWQPSVLQAPDGPDLARRPCPLEAAGVENELPPFHLTAPQEGAPALETHHAYHVKNSPPVLLSARCNNDVGTILRISKQLLELLRRRENADSAPADDIEEEKVFAAAVEEMLSSLNDLEFYCAEYSLSLIHI